MVADCDEPEVTISDALDLYVRLKGTGRGKVFARTAERNVGYLIECIGEACLCDIKPTDAGKFRDHLIAKGLSPSSVKRVMTSVKAIYNLGAKELGVTNPNPFTGIFIPDDGSIIERLPVPLDVIRTIQDECFEIDDDNRWLIAMIESGLFRHPLEEHHSSTVDLQAHSHQTRASERCITQRCSRSARD